MLVQAGKLKSRDLERALLAQHESPGILLGQLLVRLGLVSEQDVLQMVAEQFQLPLICADDLPLFPVDVPGFEADFWRTNLAYPIAMNDGVVTIAVAFPHDPFVARAVEIITGCTPKLCLVSESELEKAFQGAGQEGEGSAPDGADGEREEGNEFIEYLRDLASEAPVIRRVNQIIARVVELRASDIHLEPFEDGLHVRYRIDGEIATHETISAGMAAAIVSRVKLMAHLDIAERRLPQDGRIRSRVKGRELDLRVSAVPTVHGESVVLRVLDRSSVRFELEEMGFEPDTLKTFRSLIARPHGILLVTGPTGSGKTTTLYSALAKLDADAHKIITVEDPVEYQLPGINQIQVHTAIGLTFARLLRSILRQDPDIIMIGEMRDTETAQIAVQAALTGHLVLSTLHTNTAAGALVRLQDMGVERYLITSSVTGVLAQRLVRRLCQHCRQPYEPQPEIFRQLGVQVDGPQCPQLYRAVGCPHCRGTGYWGRTAVHELLIMDTVLQRAVIEGADAASLQALACRQGMRTLREDGLRKALRGVTTLEEVLRLTEDAGDV
ncbi:GspE/PulE family protein [Tepidimonas alkaliphilus]|nr:ATPase, T2SS/T4P/T4SS family [Tepidimonas alkaliphilus]